MSSETTTAPRIYVACLAAYNNGILYGRWIDATQDENDIYAEVAEMLKGSPIPLAEEWAIHDFEGFAPHRLSEYDSFETVSRIAQGIEEHGEAFAVGPRGTDDPYCRVIVAELANELDDDLRQAIGDTLDAQRYCCT